MHRPYWGVSHDSNGAVKVAMQELFALGFRNYAFAGFFVNRAWSRERAALFRQMVAGRGLSGVVLPNGGGDRFEYLRRIEKWILTLPRPCGILAANDRIGEHILKTCKKCGICVPDEIAVVGIDNDLLICENTTPTLTSVMPDFEESGYRAAELLDEVMSRDSSVPEVRVFPMASLVRRGSTRKLNAGNVRLIKSVEFIRLNACRGIGVEDVVREIGVNRRSAERRFLAMSGRTIADEIRSVRFAQACEMLATGKQDLETIGSACGYGDYTAFRKFFRSMAGVPPGEWRNLHSKKS